MLIKKIKLKIMSLVKLEVRFFKSRFYLKNCSFSLFCIAPAFGFAFVFIYYGPQNQTFVKQSFRISIIVLTLNLINELLQYFRYKTK